MTHATQVVALDGLDDAIIGTCNQLGGGEVVAYDYRKVSDDYTQKVRVVNTVDTYVNGGDLNVSGNLDIGNTVDVNLQAINGNYNAVYNSPDKHEDEYYRIPVYTYE